MEIGKEELLEVNRRFGGNLRSGSSLDFALTRQSDPRLGDYTKLAYLWRAILVDHPFTDGNKRTAVYVGLRLARARGLRVDEEALVRQAVDIAKENITDIRRISRRLHHALEERS